MPGYVVVIAPDPAGVPQGKTYFLGEDEKILAVVALLESPASPQVKVIQEGLHVRTGPGEEYPIIRSLSFGDVLQVLEQKKDYFANDWVRIAANEWICRVYQGKEKALFV